MQGAVNGVGGETVDIARTIELALSSPVARLDGFVSDNAGFGDVARDRTKSYHFDPDAYAHGDMRLKWREDPLIAAYVEKPVRAMLRRGFAVNTGDRDLDDYVRGRVDALHLERELKRAAEFGRAYRGGGVVLKFDDADEGSPQRLAMQVRPGARLLAVEAYDEMELQAMDPYWDHRPLSLTFGQPLQWRWSPAAGRGALHWVHPSRVLILSGPVVGNWDRFSHGGWGESRAHRVLQPTADFYASVRALLCTLQSSDLFVVGVKNLVQLRARDDGSNLLAKLTRSWAHGRSNAGVLPVDADLETAQRMSASLSGLKEAFEPIKETLAAAYRMPLSEIFGQEPTGLNANGSTSQERYDDEVAAGQKEELEPAILAVARAVVAERAIDYRGDMSVRFAPLRQPTDDEQATTRLKVAQADQIYVDMGARPVDVLRSRFGGEKYSAETHVSEEWLAAQEKASLRQAKARATAPPPQTPPSQPSQQAQLQLPGVPRAA